MRGRPGCGCARCAAGAPSWSPVRTAGPARRRRGARTTPRSRATARRSRSSAARRTATGEPGAVVTATSNLGGDGRHAEVYVRDRRDGTTKLVSTAVRGDASSPSLSADGRFVAFVGRVGRPNGTPESLRSRIWVYDRMTQKTTLVSRADGRRG